MRQLKHEAKSKPNALTRYGQNMGRLMERRLTEAALIAARQEAEREAAEAKQARREIEQAAAALHAEIAVRQGAQSRLAFLASHDPLTALPNRTLFNERLALAMDEARRLGQTLALLYLDLDNFKDVNDTLGHGIGDGLLQTVAGRIEKQLRRNEIVARIGGDEFAILLIGIRDAAQASALGNRLIVALGEPFEVDGRRIFVGASIGITIFPDDAGHLELLHRNADLAMYRAKGNGRNRCQLFDGALQSEVNRRSMLEQALREPALMSQLRLVYQPQMDLRIDRISGVEALLRWQHPDHGDISPEEFIPIAERSGMIQDIGTWVLRESCRQAASWRDEGLPKLPVSVNVSTVQFRVGDLPRLVADVLAETGLPASWLELEVTETGIMHDMKVAANILNALHAQGVGLAIDDFGTGYSSLSYLRSVPVDRIKIDRSFVKDVVASEDAAVIASTIVNLAHNLRMEVVAEGVETEQQAAFIRATGCAFVQGYYYGKPTTAAGIRDRMVAATSKELA
jgi:diguanylate cyclase (GGDEF)-like protein